MDPENHQSLLIKESRDTQCYHCSVEGRKRLGGTNPLFWILVATGHIVISISTIAILLRTPALSHRLAPAPTPHSSTVSNVNHLLFDDSLRHSTRQPDADAWKHSKYTGSPSHSSDAAWENLQEVRGVAISPEQALSLNIPNTGLSAGNGTTATLLGIQHNLHCIRFIRQVLHPSYYYPNQDTDAERDGRVMHAGHCLEALRQSVMCTPDLTPRGVIWEDDERGNIAVNPSVRLECLQWESLVGWMRKKEYTLTDLWEANPAEGGKGEER